MIPPAAIGFIFTGILFAVYSFTFNFFVGKFVKQAKGLSYSFYCLALAFFLWGLAVLSANYSVLSLFVVIGDLLIIIGSVFLFSIQLSAVRSGRMIAIVSGILFVSVFLWLRISYFPPSPAIVNGILLFNTQIPIAALLAVLIVGVWLPTNIKIAHIIANKLHDKSFSFVYSFIFVMTTIAALLFISAKTVLIIILSFSGIVLCFGMLLASTLVTGKVLKEHKR